MANVSLIPSNDISITQTGSEIELKLISSSLLERNKYSTTEEIPIGKWIDGKTIYRKVYQVNSPNDTSVAHVAELSNVETVIDIKGMLFYSNQQVPLTLAYSTTVMNAIMVEGSYINVKVSANAYTDCPCNIIVEYTKTS